MLGERRQSQGEAMEPPPEMDAGALASKPLPRGDTQINGDGLN